MFSKIRQKINTLSGVPLKERIIFTRNLALMIRTGISLPKGLETLKDQTSNQKLKIIISNLEEQIKKGESFADSLKQYEKIFKQLYINMIKSGEVSGKLEKTLETLAVQMEKERKLRSQVIGALIYPLVILVVMIGIGIIMMVYAVPNLVQVFESFNAELPFSTRAIISISNFMSNYIFLLLFIIIIAIIGNWYFFLRTQSGKIARDWAILNIPLISSIAKKVNSARFSRTFHSLVVSGMSILESIEITKSVMGNYFYKKSLEQTKIDVEKGANLYLSFAKYPKLYPPIVTNLISVGEETGSLDIILIELAQFYEDDVANITKNLGSIIEPVLMVFIGSGVGFFAVSILQPIYSLTSSIG